LTRRKVTSSSSNDNNNNKIYYFLGNFGVRDFWAQFLEAGGNWYEGKYGAVSGWAIPLLQSLGIETRSGVGIDVPIKKKEFGKPIAVNIGGGVGPYYQQIDHIGVDWLNGKVEKNFDFRIPFLGTGFRSGWDLRFPSASSIVG
uniref:Omp85 domain-containing protein n=1 Tax=Enterobius vermicularis TaxID=51028 RepID=A0A0N4VRC1_ENTVE